MIMQKIYQQRSQTMRNPLLILSQQWKFVIVMTLALLVQLSNVSAQVRKVTGKVLSGQDSQPVPGVTIRVKGSTVGTTTNSKGEYSIDANANATLVFSSVGFKAQEAKVGTRSQIDVALSEAASDLDEVVVVGYGQMKKTDLSSSQVTVGAADIKRTVNTTIDQALQGRAANVYVTNNTGKPGGGVSVNIRGVSSISGDTDPLYVIDGVQILPGSNGAASTPLASINPDDVETINVLQGPSAQAIYGSRSANGVVVITTKKGKSGQTKISYSTMYATQQVPKLLPVMNLRQYAAYDNIYKTAIGSPLNPLFADPSVLGEGTNWQKELFSNAPMSKHQLSMSGGNEKTTFYLSGEYMKQDGIAILSGFDRYSFRTNLDNQATKWLKVGTSIALSGTSEKLSVTDDNLINTAITQSPDVPVRDAEGNYGGPPQKQFALSNPVALANINQNTFKRTMGLGSLYAEATFLKDFVFRTEVNTNLEFTNSYKFNPTYSFGGVTNAIATSSRASNKSLYWSLNQTLRYTKKIQAHDFAIMLGHEAQESNWESLSGAASGFISNNISELSLGNTTSSNSSKGSFAMESYFTRLNYQFNDKYILQLAMRADASSTFGANNRWGYFPSVSGAWKISKENFMKDITFVDDLKLRVEYGLTGNQSAGGNTIYSALTPISTQWGKGYLTGNIANPDFQWESTKTLNFGFDFHALKNRLEVIFDIYSKNTDNLILQMPLPSYMGTATVSSPFVNIGAMENKGFGISVNTVNVEGRFRWKSGVTFSMDRNKLTKLYTESSIVDRSPWFMNNFISRSVVGQPLWQFYAYSYDGVFQTLDEVKNSPIPSTSKVDQYQGTWVGDVKFKDINGDGVIDEKDRSLVGSPWPDFVFGISNNVSYKNFDLSIFIQGTQGNSIFNYTRYNNGAPGRSGPFRGALQETADFAKLSADGTTLSNPGTNVPRVTITDANGNNRPTTQYIEDGSYIRVKNITLAYNVPNAWLKATPIKGLRLTGGVQNALTFTKYSGYDPEVGTFKDQNGYNMVGIDYGRYPSTRMYTFSLSADF